MHNELRKQFPFLKRDPTFIFFDNAATTQKPEIVLQALESFHVDYCAPVHRATYARAEKATQLYEEARNIVACYLNAESSEIVFTKNATESINFVAQAWAVQHLKKGDEILITQLEHHANIIPWQQITEKTCAVLKILPVDDSGLIREDLIDSYINERTKLVAFVDSSNAIGSYTPKELLIKRARAVGAAILLDACQSAPHASLDVKKLEVDFLVFSGHKMLAPTGIGVLYIAKKIQPYVTPYQFGGGMILQADYEKASWLTPPHMYEAGTPPIAQAIALGIAINYLTSLDQRALKNYQATLCSHLIDGLEKIPGIQILGPQDQLRQKGHLVSFMHETIHHHDIASHLDAHNIAVRAGHYCAQPLAQRLGIYGSVRVSFYLYNTLEEVDYFLKILKKLF